MVNGEVRGQPTDPHSPGKMAVKMGVCVLCIFCFYWIEFSFCCITRLIIIHRNISGVRKRPAVDVSATISSMRQCRYIQRHV